MKNFRYHIILTMLLAMLACKPQRPPVMEASEQLPPIYPDYVGVTIPAEIAPMNFCLADPNVQQVYVDVKGSKGGSMSASGEWADFDIDAWHDLAQANTGGTLTFDVYVLGDDGKWSRYAPFEMLVSEQLLRDYGITYRKIAPGYETFSKIGIYQRQLGTFDETPILEETAVEGQCLNCHYSNRGNPEQYTIHIRGAKGGTLMGKDGELKYFKTKTDETQGNCTYGYWHPDGRYYASSLNRIYQNFYVNREKNIEAWDAFSDIVIWDTQADELLLDDRLMTDDFETTPAFSADGSKMYFCHAPKANMPADYNKLRYSLCAVDFDKATGRLGERIDTIIKADSIGMSISYPRPSYDGRYLMYNVTEWGTSPAHHQDCDLWLMDLATGETRAMSELNSDQSDGYHNWSPSGGWFLFSSKRGDGMYAFPYFAMIAEDGIATKPFLLPQRNPLEYYSRTWHSFNAPDFISAPMHMDATQARRLVTGSTPIPLHSK